MRWNYTYNPDLWPALISLALVTFLGWYCWRRRSVPGAKPFGVACVFAMLWSLGATMEVAAVDFPAKVFWIKFQTAWQMPAATAIMCFVLVYVGFGRWLTRRNLVLLAIPPLITLFLIITNDYHHLVWAGFRMDEHILPLTGSANNLLVGYAYIIALINLFLLLWLAVRSPQHRWPVAIMISGQLIGRGFYLLHNIYAELLGPGESVLAVVGVLSSTYAFALFRFHVFDPVPLARSAVIEQMNEGMLVVDQQGRIADLNSAAARILGKPASDLRSQDVTRVFPLNFNLRELLGKGLALKEISLGSGEALRFYSLNITSLVNKRGQTLGQLVLLHETTEQKRTQAQIMEQQQVVATLQERERLARELHDGVGQVLGYVGMQAQSVRKWMLEGNTEKADSLLARLADVAKDAHADVRESILSLKAGSGKEWSFLPTLRRYLNDFQTNYSIRIEHVFPEGLKEDAFTPGAEVQVLRVIQEALTNARKHSGASLVRVIIEQQDGLGRITVSDDGFGFEPDQINPENGHHFGLAFMRERMEQIGGSVKIDSRPGTGTTLVLELPLRDKTKERE